MLVSDPTQFASWFVHSHLASSRKPRTVRFAHQICSARTQYGCDRSLLAGLAAFSLNSTSFHMQRLYGIQSRRACSGHQAARNATMPCLQTDELGHTMPFQISVHRWPPYSLANSSVLSIHPEPSAGRSQTRRRAAYASVFLLLAAVVVSTASMHEANACSARYRS